MRQSSARELAAIAGQPALFQGAGVTVQVPLFHLAPAPVPPATCAHSGDIQVQLTFDNSSVARCCACGEIAASRWPRP